MKKFELLGTEYTALLKGVSNLLESARRTSARSVNSVITLTYWHVGRQISEIVQGKQRALYGQKIIKQLAIDLTKRFGRGFSKRNIHSMLKFYQLWSELQIEQNAYQNKEIQIISKKGQIVQTPSAQSLSAQIQFPLPWSHYVRLLSVEKKSARDFYEYEAIRGGWSERQLERQINSQFYERTLLSKNKAAMLKKGQKAEAGDYLTPEEEIKDPLVLEFLDLKDEYSESDLEEALIQRLEAFLLELGGDFTFVGRQKRLRVDNEWYRVDLVFYHRGLKCLVIIDLKIGKLSHADVGQMHLYLNYAKDHWTHQDENPPVGLILCATKGQTLAKYALEGLPNKVLAAEYKMALPDEKILVAELEKSQKRFQNTKRIRS
jgi:predicted nuclease of restriction endonuclease-like (RecB) superfamily